MKKTVYEPGDIVLVEVFGYDEPRFGVILEKRTIGYNLRKNVNIKDIDVNDYFIMIQSEQANWFLEDDIVKKIVYK
jgi:hypothetical protein